MSFKAVKRSSIATEQHPERSRSAELRRGTASVADCLAEVFAGRGLAELDLRDLEAQARRLAALAAGELGERLETLTEQLAEGVKAKLESPSLSFATRVEHLLQGLEALKRLRPDTLYALDFPCCAGGVQGFEVLFRAAVRRVVLTEPVLAQFFAELRTDVVGYKRVALSQDAQSGELPAQCHRTRAMARFLADFDLLERWLTREVPRCALELWGGSGPNHPDCATALAAVSESALRNAFANASLFGDFSTALTAAERDHFVAQRAAELLESITAALLREELPFAAETVRLVESSDRGVELQRHLTAEQRRQLLSASSLAGICRVLELFSRGAAELFGDATFSWELDHQAGALLGGERPVPLVALEQALAQPTAAHFPVQGFAKLLLLTVDAETQLALCLRQLLHAHIAGQPPSQLLMQLAATLRADPSREIAEAVERFEDALNGPHRDLLDGTDFALVPLDRSCWPSGLELEGAFDAAALLSLPQMCVFDQLMRRHAQPTERRKLVQAASRVTIQTRSGRSIHVTLLQAALLLHFNTAEVLSLDLFAQKADVSITVLEQQLALLNSRGPALLCADGLLRLCLDWTPPDGWDFTAAPRDAESLAVHAEPIVADGLQRRLKAAVVRQVKRLQRVELPRLLRLLNEELGLRLSALAVTPVVEALINEGLLERCPSDPQTLLYK